MSWHLYNILINAKLWCFCCHASQTVKQSLEIPLIKWYSNNPRQNIENHHLCPKDILHVYSIIEPPREHYHHKMLCCFFKHKMTNVENKFTYQNLSPCIRIKRWQMWYPNKSISNNTSVSSWMLLYLTDLLYGKNRYGFLLTINHQRFIIHKRPTFDFWHPHLWVYDSWVSH